jgi:hypothetical protein
VRFIAVAAAIGFVATGAWIFYNTKVQNTVRSENDNDCLQADYEKTYKKFDKQPEPRVTDVKYAIDPHEHIGHIREMVAILENHGVSVRMLKADKVGYVVYEDDYQSLRKHFLMFSADGRICNCLQNRHSTSFPFACLANKRRKLAPTPDFNSYPDGLRRI